MKASVAEKQGNVVTLEVEVESPRLDEAMGKAYHKLVQKVNIPGFRKGKAPRRILENYIGKGSLFDEALDFVLPEAYLSAVKETAIEPIDRPKLELVKLEEGEPLVFKATVEVKPEPRLGAYKGIEVERPRVEVQPQDVDKAIQNLQQRFAKLVALEEVPAALGDLAVIDYEGSVEGKAFEGGKSENYTLELGSGTFIPGFEEQLVGAKAGEEREITVTFPGEYRAPELAGKEAVFKVKIRELKRRELAPLDDEFAKDVSEFETLEELRQDVENKLKETAGKEAERVVKERLVRKVVEAAEVEVPPLLKERRTKTFVEDLRQRLAMQGLALENYLEGVGIDMDGLQEGFQKQAQESVKEDLVLEAIARTEGIKVEEEEYLKEIERMAGLYGQKPEVLRQVIESQNNREELEYGITREKTIRFLVENALLAEESPVNEGVEASPAS